MNAILKKTLGGQKRLLKVLYKHFEKVNLNINYIQRRFNI